MYKSFKYILDFAIINTLQIDLKPWAKKRQFFVIVYFLKGLLVLYMMIIWEFFCYFSKKKSLQNA